MITIFWNFRQFSAKKLAFFSKPMLWSKFSFVLSQKTPFFWWIFRRKYFKIITLVPDSISRPKCSQVETIPLPRQRSVCTYDRKGF
jgi:hypothetical protein